MSRTIIASISLALLAGCHYSAAPRHLSLITARLETLGPSWHSCQADCDDCIPHRPFTGDHYITCWDYKITQHTAHVCAFRALSAYRQECGGVSHHFKMGFISAFEDLALNRQPCPPLIPPPRYWNAFYRSCAGRSCVDDWFAGYDAGRQIGSRSGVSRFNRIPLRGCNCGAEGGACCEQGQENWCGATGGAPAMDSGYAEPGLTPSPQFAPGMSPGFTSGAYGDAGLMNPYPYNNQVQNPPGQ